MAEPADGGTFRSPYNFVPISGFVHLPDSTEISHDLPFQDGYCGEIKLTLRAETPLLVSCGVERTPGNAGDANMFKLAVTPDGMIAIPGSAIRGLIRNVVEIASFGKMQAIDDKRYSVRNLHAGFYRNRTTRKIRVDGNEAYAPLARSGWMYPEAGKSGVRWKIIPCEYARVPHTLLVSHGIRPGANAREVAIEKQLLHCVAKIAPLDAHFSNTLRKIGSRVEHLAFREVTGLRPLHQTIEAGNETEGWLVFTGKLGKKKREFFFHSRGGVAVDVPAETFRIFAETNAAEADGANDDGKRTDTWAVWRKRLQSRKIGPGATDSEQAEPGIPVFYLAGNNGIPFAIGTCQMFRIPYDHSTVEMVTHSSKKHAAAAHDLAECIFGTVSGDGSTGLKGRADFSHFLLQGDPSQSEFRGILNSPKPTFYPAYVNQTGGRDSNTFLLPERGREKSELRGWKRYQVTQHHCEPRPVTYKPANSDLVSTRLRDSRREDTPELKAEIRAFNADFLARNPPAPATGHENDVVATNLHPVSSGSTFSGTMHIHNMRPYELGALLWGLLWGTAEGADSHAERPHFHALGMGKPFGFGRCSIAVTEVQLTPNDPGLAPLGKEGIERMLTEFAAHMEAAYAAAIDPNSDETSSWRDSSQIRALLSMAIPFEQRPPDYPRLVPKGSAVFDPRTGEAEWSTNHERTQLQTTNDFAQLARSHLAFPKGLDGSCVRRDSRLFPRKMSQRWPTKAELPSWY